MFTTQNSFIDYRGWCTSCLNLAVMMSPRSVVPETEISFTEMMNSTLYANKYKYVFSHKQELPLDLFEENAIRFKLRNNKPSPKFWYTQKNPDN